MLGYVFSLQAFPAYELQVISHFCHCSFPHPRHGICARSIPEFSILFQIQRASSQVLSSENLHVLFESKQASFRENYKLQDTTHRLESCTRTIGRKHIVFSMCDPCVHVCVYRSLIACIYPPATFDDILPNNECVSHSESIAIETRLNQPLNLSSGPENHSMRTIRV